MLAARGRPLLTLLDHYLVPFTFDTGTPLAPAPDHREGKTLLKEGEALLFDHTHPDPYVCKSSRRDDGKGSLLRTTIFCCCSLTLPSIT